MPRTGLAQHPNDVLTHGIGHHGQFLQVQFLHRKCLPYSSILAVSPWFDSPCRIPSPREEIQARELRLPGAVSSGIMVTGMIIPSEVDFGKSKTIGYYPRLQRTRDLFHPPGPGAS